MLSGREVWKKLEEVSYSYSKDVVFTDWINLILYAYLSYTDNLIREPDKFKENLLKNNLNGKYEEEYKKIAIKYIDKNRHSRGIDSLKDAYGLLIKETLETQEDILGNIYMSMISTGHLGQFFTPSAMADLISDLAISEKKETVLDPCCGSGRFLISAFKKNNESILIGTDLDATCCKMAVINMILFRANAEITHGNSLSGENFTTWVIRKGLVYEKSNKM